MMNIKYYLIGALVLVTAIIGYHYFAASQAEQQIGEALQKYSESEESISITHSKIDITPFSADVTISDLSIIFGNHIERANQINLDLGYRDFLNIYFGGVEYGLKHTDHAIIRIAKPTYTNRDGRQEIKSDSLIITYRGNAFDGLQNAINGTPFNNNQRLDIESRNNTFSMPNTLLSTIKAKQIHYSGSISESKSNFWLHGIHNIQLDSLIWTPSQSFQNKYSFIIKGFGYQANAIPFDHATVNSTSSSLGDTLAITGRLKSEPALISVSGGILPEQPFNNSQFDDTELSLSDFSEQFNNILANLEQLLGTSLPKENGSITFKIRGTVAEPKISQ